MSGAWTPGPWEYRKSNIAYGVVVAPADAVIDCKQTICAICDCSDYDEVSEADAIILNDRAEANARLVAASPDLAEAAVWADDHADDQDMNHETFRVEVVKRLRAALFKAKGEAA